MGANRFDPGCYSYIQFNAARNEAYGEALGFIYSLPIIDNWSMCMSFNYLGATPGVSATKPQEYLGSSYIVCGNGGITFATGDVGVGVPPILTSGVGNLGQHRMYHANQWTSGDLYGTPGVFPNVGKPTFSFNFFVNTPFATDRHGFGYQLVNESAGYTGRYPGGTPGGNSASRSVNDSLAVYTNNVVRMRIHENGRIKFGTPISATDDYFVTVEPTSAFPQSQQWFNSIRNTSENVFYNTQPWYCTQDSETTISSQVFYNLKRTVGNVPTVALDSSSPSIQFLSTETFYGNPLAQDTWTAQFYANTISGSETETIQMNLSWMDGSDTETPINSSDALVLDGGDTSTLYTLSVTVPPSTYTSAGARYVVRFEVTILTSGESVVFGNFIHVPTINVFPPGFVQLMAVGLPHGQAASNTFSSSQSVLRVSKSVLTNRSINCAGTVNSSGADYAEYMIKKDSTITFRKGDLCGITSNGTLTNLFSESISFGIKSTNPSFVGNEQDLGPSNRNRISLAISVDEITSYIQTKKLTNPYTISQADKDSFVRTAEILTDEQVDAELESRKTRRFESDIKKRMLDERIAYNTASEERFETQYEPKRFLLERIAFCGQVPVNLVGTPGDYVVPTQGPNDTIVGIAKRNVSFEEYQNAVGKIIKVLSSTQVLCIVKML